MMRLDMPEVAARLAPHMAGLCATLLGEKPSSRGRDTLRFRNRGSLSVVFAGQKRGSWHDHEAGVGGDALGLVAHLRSCSMRDARDWALRWLGIDGGGPPEPLRRPDPPVEEPARSGTLDLARRIWAEALPPVDTLVERYLAHRGLELPADAPLRFHPACPRGAVRLPAMLALMTDPCSAEPVGVHRTFLAPDGAGKAAGAAKMMSGNAGVVRLVPDAEVEQGLGLAEGIETSLSVMQRLGWRPVWAATSAGAIRTFPVLAGIEELSIFADTDDRGAGLVAALACAERWAEMARRVTVMEPPEGTDFDTATGARRAA